MKYITYARKWKRKTKKHIILVNEDLVKVHLIEHYLQNFFSTDYKMTLYMVYPKSLLKVCFNSHTRQQVMGTAYILNITIIKNKIYILQSNLIKPPRALILNLGSVKR